MKKVRRFEPKIFLGTTYEECIKEDINGDYVQYTDYQELEAKQARAEMLVERLHESCGKRLTDILLEGQDGYGFMLNAVSEALSAYENEAQEG